MKASSFPVSTAWTVSFFIVYAKFRFLCWIAKMFFTPRFSSSFYSCSECVMNLGLLRTECLISSRVAENESMSWWGSWDRKPMVSTYRTVMWLGSWPAWTVTSSVAKSWFLGWRPVSPVRALIKVVFPGQMKSEETCHCCGCFNI